MTPTEKGIAMTEKMLAAAALVTLGIMDMGGMLVLSCMEKNIPTILPETMGIVVGGLIVIAGVNGARIRISRNNGNGKEEGR